MALSLFRKREANPAEAIYHTVVQETRRPEWYRDADVPDTIDGRYCVLATLLALTDLRLGQGGDTAASLSPRLTELFVADLDIQLRESGLGDPTLGKTVRNLVTGLSGRIARWREVSINSGDRLPVIRASLYRDSNVGEAPLCVADGLIADWQERLARSGDEALRDGSM